MADAAASSSAVKRFMLASASMWQREIVRFYRQRSRIVGALGSPLVFWLLIGSGLGRSFRPSDMENAHYLEYFFPGTLLLILLFTAIFSTISIIEDRREGFLQGVLVAPVARGSIAMGKILGGATLATMQGLLFLLISPFVGINISPAMGFLLILVLFLVSFGLTGLGFVIAWQMNSTQGFHAIMNLLLIPMWLLSGALFPPSGAAMWMRVLMACNPVTYNLALMRHLMYRDGMNLPANMPGFGLALAVTILFAALMFAASTMLVCKRK